MGITPPFSASPRPGSLGRGSEHLGLSSVLVRWLLRLVAPGLDLGLSGRSLLGVGAPRKTYTFLLFREGGGGLHPTFLSIAPARVFG